MEFIAGMMIAGLIAAAIIFGIMSPNGSLAYAQEQYLKCIALQAPQEVCLKTYLLPKGEKQ